VAWHNVPLSPIDPVKAAVISSLLQDIFDRLAYLVVRIFVCVVQALPLDTCALLARRLATICTRVLRIRRELIEENLRHAFPQLTAGERTSLTWRMWEHLFLMIFEVVHAPRKIHDTNWRDYITLYRTDDLVRAFFDDRATIIICGHYGNFELSGYAMAVLGFPSFTVARPLDNPYLDRFLNEFRANSGQFILSKTGSAGQIESVLERGGNLALLGDQYAGPKGCWVDFFGRPASSHKAVALLTLGNPAQAVFCFCRRVDNRPLCLVMGTEGTLDPRQAGHLTVTEVTEWYTQLLEHTIRIAPEQYWWLHRRWRDTRGNKRKKRTASQAA
jgi:KDO2-lipid IV(A) lauroyltransferase